MSRRLSDSEKSDRVRRMIGSYESGKTLEEVGQQFGGISRERVRQIFKEEGFKPRKQTYGSKAVKSRQLSAARRRKNLPCKKLENLYLGQTLSSNGIAGIFRCAGSTVIRNLKRCGIPIRDHKEVSKLRIKCPALTAGILRESYLLNNLTAREIAAEYGCSLITVKRKLKKFALRKK